jgi:hypothetical protein
MAYTMVVIPAIKGWHAKWWVVGEVWPPMMAARYVANGAFPYLYEADRFFVATPLGAIVLAPVAALGQAFHLSDNYRFVVPRPTLWLVYDPYALGLGGVLFLYAARTLALRVWLLCRPSEGRTPGLLWTQIALFGLVLFPAAVVFGHFEDVLTLAFLLLGIRALLDERWARGALLFGAAIAFKQWALLGLPLAVALAPRNQRWRSLRAGLVLPAALVAIPLAADWAHASVALFRPQSFTELGQAALWIHRSTNPTVGTPFRMGGVLAAVGIAFLIRGRSEPPVVLAAFALAFLVRLAFEPVLFAYYLSPPLALFFLHERARGGSGLRTLVLGAGWMAFFLLHGNPVLWWVVSVGLAALVARAAVGDVWRAARSPRTQKAPSSAVAQDTAPLEPVSS